MTRGVADSSFPETNRTLFHHIESCLAGSRSGGVIDQHDQITARELMKMVLASKFSGGQILFPTQGSKGTSGITLTEDFCEHGLCQLQRIEPDKKPKYVKIAETGKWTQQNFFWKLNEEMTIEAIQFVLSAHNFGEKFVLEMLENTLRVIGTAAIAKGALLEMLVADKLTQLTGRSLKDILLAWEFPKLAQGRDVAEQISIKRDSDGCEIARLISEQSSHVLLPKAAARPDLFWIPIPGVFVLFGLKFYSPSVPSDKAIANSETTKLDNIYRTKGGEDQQAVQTTPACLFESKKGELTWLNSPSAHFVTRELQSYFIHYIIIDLISSDKLREKDHHVFAFECWELSEGDDLNTTLRFANCRSRNR